MTREEIREEICNSMTVQDAVRVLKETNCYGTMDIAKSVIIKALEPQPEERTEERTETHACDCISRQAVIDSLHSKFADGFNSDKWWNSTAVLNAISELPSATPQLKTEPQQKTGHWIEHKHGAIEHIECSECGIWFLKADLPRKSYCPNCGSCNGNMIKNIMRDIAKQ